MIEILIAFLAGLALGSSVLVLARIATTRPADRLARRRLDDTEQALRERLAKARRRPMPF